MAKHRRWSDKQKSEPTQSEDKETELEQEIAPPKTQTKSKSLILSGTKYIYIVAVAALFSGVFTPLTLGVEIEIEIFGMLSIFIVLA